jgi:hypothetical protein
MYRYLSKRSFSTNPFASKAHKELKVGGKTYNYYNINSIGNIGKKNNFLHNRKTAVFN